MAIKFTYDGIQFEVSTAREAAQLARELRRQQPASGHTTRGLDLFDNAAGGRYGVGVVGDGLLVLPSGGEERVESTLQFLSEIRGAGKNPSGGLSASEVTRILKVKHPKGLGPRSTLINNVLRDLGFDPSQVYNNDRTAHGRLWIAQPKIDEAIALLKRALQP